MPTPTARKANGRIISAETFIKPLKYAALMGVSFTFAGLVLDGETKRLIDAGLFALIFFLGGVIAEFWRPTRRRVDASRNTN